MGMQQPKRDHHVDEASEQSFPASDPPSFTPGSGVGDRAASDKDSHHRRTVAAEKAERRRDPHGTAPARHADQDEPAGQPTADRHRTETAVHRVGKE